MPRKQLVEMARNILLPCAVCAEAKPNQATDRGLVGSLPIPQLANDLVYVDFIQADPFDNFDYVMKMVDALVGPEKLSRLAMAGRHRDASPGQVNQALMRTQGKE